MEILHFMVKRWLSRVNGNPKEKEETDLNSTSVTAMNMDKAKMVDVLVTNERRIAIAKHFESLKMNHDSVYSLVQSLGSGVW